MNLFQVAVKAIMYGPFLVLCLLALNGCGAKQSKPPEVAMPKVAPQDFSDDPLSSSEKAALATTGQVDKNVPDHAMADVALQYKYFLRKGRQTMCVFSKRSEQYLAYARQVFRERGMPEELANLAIVESGYRPDAVSSAGAAGAWQFMPYTGAKYGLAQDWWQDERLDPYRATEAAADYLQKLYNDFGDWPTAIAAYNAGEGKMSRAKDGTGGKDFFEVKALNHKLDEKAQLREETRQYVPRFIAVTKIMRNLPQLGFEPIEPEKQPGVSRFTAKPGTDLAAFSKACNLSWDEFSSYNLHHKRSVTCTDRHTFIYVPSRVEKLASAYLCSARQANFAGWKPVRVARSNDSLEKISRRVNVPLGRLQAANPGLGRLKAGQIILAPCSINTVPKAIAASDEKSRHKKTAARERVATASAAATRHTLKSNETLYAVARKYNISVADLQKHNSIDNPAKIKAGHVLSIPGGKAGEGAPLKGGSRARIGVARKKTTYVVQARDNLWNIARKHNVSVGDLKRWNHVNEANLKPGSTLVVAED